METYQQQTEIQSKFLLVVFYGDGIKNDTNTLRTLLPKSMVKFGSIGKILPTINFRQNNSSNADNQ